jgi:methionyl-tRNA formyltransferase
MKMTNIKNTRVAVAGCKSTTEYLIRSLHQAGLTVDLLITISPQKAQKVAVADYKDLRSFAINEGIECYTAHKYHLKTIEDQTYLTTVSIDVLFVIGWQRLIPPWLLNHLSQGAFGMHGSADNLPKGRGRSPINWSLIEGRTSFTTNLFRYDAGVDSGDILDSITFCVTSADTAETCHFKNSLAMKTLIIRHYNAIISGEFNLRKQSDNTATFYPKRRPTDSLIDWSSSIHVLHRFIRAVTKPFNGAFTHGQAGVVRLYRAEVFETQLFGFDQCIWGQVVEIFPHDKFLIRVNGGLLLVHEYEGQIALNEVLHDAGLSRQIFATNDRGYHDLTEEELKSLS